MAAVIGDFMSDAGHFTMRPSSGTTVEHHQHPAATDATYRSSATRSQQSPYTTHGSTSSSTGHRAPSDHSSSRSARDNFPTPPPSSASHPESGAYAAAAAQQAEHQGAVAIPQSERPREHPPTSSSAPRPSLNTSAGGSHTPVPRSSWSHDDLSSFGGTTIKVRDLQHIQTFANEEFLASRGPGGRHRTSNDSNFKYEISGMPITDIIEMVAGLLTKITTTNDRQHETLHRPVHPAEGSSNLTGLTSSVLAFHGKNVPSITILSYLSRIHKYCPTTYEVFLSLLVYFDRMAERVNAMPLHQLSREHHDMDQYQVLTDSTPTTPLSARPGMDFSFHDSPVASSGTATPNLSHFFVVDSFNIHRLVIAGVTCASKFFSDVFYTNSRYAKVGGLPLAELNHLELQFLLLNDFRLSVPVEELEAYGTMLVEFYAREVISQRQKDDIAAMAYPDDAMTGVASV